MSEQGERGDQGQRGVAGERGPKGDHGQHGDTGKTGATGKVTVVHDEARERKRDRKALYRAAQLLAFPVAILALVPSLFGIYLTQREIKRNCIRGNENRAALRLTFEDAARRTATSKQRTAAEKTDAKEFYDAALARLPIKPC